MKNKIYFLYILSSLFCFLSCKKTVNIPLNDCETRLSNIEPPHSKATLFQNLLDEYIKKGLPGVVAIVQTPDESLWIGAAGKAKIETNEAMQVCHLLHSASVSKTYMVTAAMTLVEDGQLDLDATIDTYLTQDIYADIPNINTATVRQLMNHSSGIPDFIETNNHVLDYFQDLTRTFSTEEYLDYINGKQADFEAGKHTFYSNTNTVLLALVMDNITGASHANLISDRIIKKLELMDTYYKNEEGYPAPDGLVNTYIELQGNKQLQNSTAWERNFANMSIGHDGMMASTYDYYRFLKALFSGEVVSAASLEQMMETFFYSFPPNYPVDSPKIGNGLGLEVATNGGFPDRYGHNGASLGAANNVFYYPEKDTYIVICSNFGGFLSPMEAIFYSDVIGKEGVILGDFERLVFKN